MSILWQNTAQYHATHIRYFLHIVYPILNVRIRPHWRLSSATPHLTSRKTKTERGKEVHPGSDIRTTISLSLPDVFTAPPHCLGGFADDRGTQIREDTNIPKKQVNIIFLSKHKLCHIKANIIIFTWA